MANTQEAVSLTAETRKAPVARASAYVSIGEQAEQVGGGLVYLSRNRKAVAAWSAPDPKPPVHLTSEAGTAQQSIPLRAIGTALVADIMAVAQVIDLYASNGRMADVLAVLLSEAPRKVDGADAPSYRALLASAVAEVDGAADVLADMLTAEEAEQEDGATGAEVDGAADGAATEVTAEDLALQ
jgi:hypothetical protein